MRSVVVVGVSVFSVATAFFGALLGAASAKTTSSVASLDDVAALVGVAHVPAAPTPAPAAATAGPVPQARPARTITHGPSPSKLQHAGVTHDKSTAHAHAPSHKQPKR